EVLRMSTSARPSSPGFQPMPTSCVQPKRSPLGACRSRSSVSGRAPPGPAALVCTSRGGESSRGGGDKSFIEGISPGSVSAPGKGREVTGSVAASKADEVIEGFIVREGTARDEVAVASTFEEEEHV